MLKFKVTLSVEDSGEVLDSFEVVNLGSDRAVNVMMGSGEGEGDEFEGEYVGTDRVHSILGRRLQHEMVTRVKYERDLKEKAANAETA